MQRAEQHVELRHADVDADWGDTIRVAPAEKGWTWCWRLAASPASCSLSTPATWGKVVVGTTANGVPELPLGDMVMRHIRVDGIAAGSMTQLRDLVAFLATRDIRPVIDRHFLLEQLADAFRYQLSRDHFGKIILDF
ncbi:zinc-binding dehydrogenase [Sphingobium sp.]|uniref:zinc-binding dehydrogenase n=1 Tax=Sphingobium sp. TaxID=1912891 RepID=UPI002C67AF5A|nr:zinc-binding dehydrogenase [Sphingobium sp.]HUD90096.1 zinc-binding dehydrogenase [Sphingobium sp.]